MQEVDVLDEKVEHGDDDLLPAAVGRLGPLRGSPAGLSVVAEIVGRVHVVLWADGRMWWALHPIALRPAQDTLCRNQLWAARRFQSEHSGEAQRALGCAPSQAFGLGSEHQRKS